MPPAPRASPGVLPSVADSLTMAVMEVLAILIQAVVGLVRDIVVGFLGRRCEAFARQYAKRLRRLVSRRWRK